MTKAVTVRYLNAARKLLEAGFIRWREDDGKGGYCASGALMKAASYRRFTELVQITNGAARELFPSCTNTSKPRRDGRFESFDYFPTVFVNNHLGKKAILRVFDRAIENVRSGK